METKEITLLGIILRTIVVHTVTYWIVGILAFTILDFSTWFAEPGWRGLMRPTDDPMVTAGPLFQPIRGLFFGFVFYWLGETFFDKKNGWLIMWGVLVLLGILSTFGPIPGSVEGLIYTTLPFGDQLLGLIEILLQSCLLSVVLSYWVNHPEKRWITWVSNVLFVIVILFSSMGMLSAGTA